MVASDLQEGESPQLEIVPSVSTISDNIQHGIDSNNCPFSPNTELKQQKVFPPADSECVSISSGSDDQGYKDSGSSSESRSEASCETSKKLISKPIIDGKTCTTILYEIIASIGEPISIKYFQIDTSNRRTRHEQRGARFKVECHLSDKLYGIGEGSSKKCAKQLASKVALDRLLDERPQLRDDVGRVRKGNPSKKKIHSRRRRVETHPDNPAWRRDTHQQYPQRPNSFDTHFEMQQRRRLASEFEAVNRMVANIEHLNDCERDSRLEYLGFDGMTPYEYSLLNDHPSYYDSSECCDRCNYLGYCSDCKYAGFDISVGYSRDIAPDILNAMGHKTATDMMDALNYFTPKSSYEAGCVKNAETTSLNLIAKKNQRMESTNRQVSRAR